MTEHQRRLWREMIGLVDSYSQGRIDFGTLVGSLEGALDAAEFSDRDLVKRWYDAWTPLETHRAVRGPVVPISEVMASVEAMKRFLVDEAPEPK
jgi:alkanesulfonate monooxygenase SsuD/methylene tetrahydromethanopterin reductase-like flavin-dependent oxidoreductase (luciferase family)